MCGLVKEDGMRELMAAAMQSLCVATGTAISTTGNTSDSATSQKPSLPMLTCRKCGTDSRMSTMLTSWANVRIMTLACWGSPSSIARSADLTNSM